MYFVKYLLISIPQYVFSKNIMNIWKNNQEESVESVYGFIIKIFNNLKCKYCLNNVTKNHVAHQISFTYMTFVALNCATNNNPALIWNKKKGVKLFCIIECSGIRHTFPDHRRHVTRHNDPRVAHSESGHHPHFYPAADDPICVKIGHVYFTRQLTTWYRNRAFGSSEHFLDHGHHFTRHDNILADVIV